MKKKRRLMVLLLFLFVVISINASYAKVVGFFNQSTNRTEYYSSYDRDETFTDRDEAEEYDNELRAEREEENDTTEDESDTNNDKEDKGVKSPDIGKMIQEWIVKLAVNVAKSTKGSADNHTDGLSPNGMFLNNVLHLETHLPILGSYYTTLSAYIKSIAMSIIVLYALWYGFKVYVLWKDGSPDENPKEIIVRFMLASAFILSGDEMLHIATTFVASIINKIMNIGGSIQGGTVLDFISRIGAVAIPGAGIGFTVILLVFEIVYFFQYWKMMLHTVMLGIEFFVLRLIMPLPCVNIVNPQANTWSAYVTTLIKTYAGICLNILLLSIGVKIHDTSAGGQWCGLYACAFLITANKSKELLNQFIVGSQSGVSGSSVMGTAGQIITIGKQVFKGAVTGGAGAALP